MGGAHPRVRRRGVGARFRCVDGHEYVDFCLGDTGAMTGHSPRGGRGRHRGADARGITTMLPGEDAIRSARRWRAASACRTGSSPSRPPTPTGSRCGSPARSPAGRRCSSSTTATTARSTRRSPRSEDGEVVPRRGNIGPPVRPAETTPGRGVERPRRRSRRRSRQGDVACVLVEPALTNVGHRAPRARVPRRPPRADAPVRDAPHHRRDPHDLRRPRRLHAGARPRAGPPDDRQGRSAAGSRPAAYGFSAEVAARVSASIERRGRATSAASAAPWPGTRCRWRRSARRSARSSRRRRSSA